jgi:urease accessory protein
MQMASESQFMSVTDVSGRHWHARLDLHFTEREGRSYLAQKQHVGPLVLQKTLYPEGQTICHGVIVHPPGGVAGGDALTLALSLSRQSKVLLTTPGAGKWYKANGQEASQHLIFNLQDEACLEWLPQENILFDGSQVKFSAEIKLSKNARYAGWEILCFGRQAQGETWNTGAMHQNVAIYREGARIWLERASIQDARELMHSVAGLNGNAVSASFVIAAGAVPAEVLTHCREIQPKLALDMHARYGVTALPEIFSARYIGQSAQCARAYFEQLWQILRPWYLGCDSVRPRIWNT